MIRTFNFKSENLLFTKLPRNINKTCFILIKLSTTRNVEMNKM